MCREQSHVRDIMEQPSLWVLHDRIISCLELQVHIDDLPPPHMEEMKQYILRTIAVVAHPPFSRASLSSDRMTLPKLVRMIPDEVRSRVRELSIAQSGLKSPATKAAERARASAAAAAVAMITATLAAAYGHLAMLEGVGADAMSVADAATADAEGEATDAAFAAGLMEVAATVAALEEAAEVAAGPLWAVITDAHFPMLVSLCLRFMDVDMDVIRTGLPLLDSLACVECVNTRMESLSLIPSLRHLHIVSELGPSPLPYLNGMTHLTSLVLLLPRAPLVDLFNACTTLAGLKRLHLSSEHQHLDAWGAAHAMFAVSNAVPLLEDLLLHFHPCVPFTIPGSWSSLKTLFVGAQIRFLVVPQVTKLRVINSGHRAPDIDPLPRLSPSVSDLMLPMVSLPSAIGCSLTSLVCTASRTCLSDTDNSAVCDALRHGAWSQLRCFMDLPGHNMQGRFWDGVDQEEVEQHCASTAVLLHALTGHGELKHTTLHHRCSSDCRALGALVKLHTLRSVTLVDIAISSQQIATLARMPNMMLIELIGVPRVDGHVPSCDDRVVVDGGRVVRVVWRALDVLYDDMRVEASKNVM